MVWPALVYGAEAWSTTKSQEKRLKVYEMRMLRWMCGVTKKDKIRNDHVRESVKVAPVTKKITEKRLKWYGLIGGGHAKKNVRCTSIIGRRRRGRQKTSWKDF